MVDLRKGLLLQLAWKSSASWEWYFSLALYILNILLKICRSFLPKTIGYRIMCSLWVSYLKLGWWWERHFSRASPPRMIIDSQLMRLKDTCFPYPRLEERTIHNIHISFGNHNRFEVWSLLWSSVSQCDCGAMRRPCLYYLLVNVVVENWFTRLKQQRSAYRALVRLLVSLLADWSSLSFLQNLVPQSADRASRK